MNRAMRTAIVASTLGVTRVMTVSAISGNQIRRAVSQENPAVRDYVTLPSRSSRSYSALTTA